MLLPAYRRRFYRSSDAALRLVYGRTDIEAPRYDLAIIAPRLLDAPAEEVTPAPEGQPGANASGHAPQILFWSALGSVVIVLLLLIGRLVRGGHPRGAEPGTTPGA